MVEYEKMRMLDLMNYHNYITQHYHKEKEKFIKEWCKDNPELAGEFICNCDKGFDNGSIMSIINNEYLSFLRQQAEDFYN